MKFSLGVTRRNYGNECSTPYTLLITDEGSRVNIELHLTAEQFANAFTGLHTTEIWGDITGNPSNIGKKKITEVRSIIAPKDAYTRYAKDAAEVWLKENAQEEGWFFSSSLRSQDSVTWNNDGSSTLKYSVYKWE